MLLIVLVAMCVGFGCSESAPGDPCDHMMKFGMATTQSESDKELRRQCEEGVKELEEVATKQEWESFKLCISKISRDGDVRKCGEPLQEKLEQKRHDIGLKSEVTGE